MKFTVKHPFKHGYSQFEQGNTHDSAVLGISDAEVQMFYDAGWADIEGETPGPDIDPKRRVTLSVKPIKIGHAAETAGVKADG